MRFTIEQRFGAEPQRVVEALTDPELYPTLVGLSKVSTPVVVSREQNGDDIELRLQMRFVGDLSSAARAVIDPSKISWVQQERYDLRALEASVRFLPDNYADRFSCTGAYRFVPDPADASRTVMHCEGDLKVRMPLVGGQVERALVSGLEEHFAEEQPLIEQWLNGR